MAGIRGMLRLISSLVIRDFLETQTNCFVRSDVVNFLLGLREIMRYPKYSVYKWGCKICS